MISTEQADAADADAFDPATFASEEFDDIAAGVTRDAIPLTELLAALEAGADEADYGNTSGASSAFAFPVTFEGVAGQLAAPVLPITVDGVPASVTVQVQVGPAITGTALRDVSGTISFNQFTNQLEYQEVSTELNSIVRDDVLAAFDAAAAQGKTVRVTGAYLRVNPALVSVVPVSIEVLP